MAAIYQWFPGNDLDYEVIYLSVASYDLIALGVNYKTKTYTELGRAFLGSEAYIDVDITDTFILREGGSGAHFQYSWRGNCFSVMYTEDTGGNSANALLTIKNMGQRFLLQGQEAFGHGIRALTYEIIEPFDFVVDYAKTASNDDWWGLGDLRYNNNGKLEKGDALVCFPLNNNNITTYEPISAGADLALGGQLNALNLGNAAVWGWDRDSGIVISHHTANTHFDAYQVNMSDLTLSLIGELGPTDQDVLAASPIPDETDIFITCENTGTTSDIVRTYRRLNSNDPYELLVTMLLHMDGSDGSTVITDSSKYKQVTAGVGGDCQLDTAEKKFGTASCLFDGTGDYVYWTYYNDRFDWFVEDYTLDLWVYAASWASWSTGNIPCCIGRYNSGSATHYWSLGPMSDGKLRFRYWNGSEQLVTSTGTCPTNEWVHIAMTMSGNTIRLFINGVLDGSAAIVGTPQSASQGLAIGQYNNQCITGWVDEVRITKGVARWTSNFTPPSAPISAINAITKLDELGLGLQAPNTSAHFRISPYTKRIWLIGSGVMQVFDVAIDGTITRLLTLPYRVGSSGKAGGFIGWVPGQDGLNITSNGFTGIKEKLYQCWEMNETGSVTRQESINHYIPVDLPVLVGTVGNRTPPWGGNAADFGGEAAPACLQLTLGNTTTELLTQGTFAVMMGVVVDDLTQVQSIWTRGRNDAGIDLSQFDCGFDVDPASDNFRFWMRSGTTYYSAAATVGGGIGAGTWYILYGLYDKQNDQISMRVNRETAVVTNLPVGTNMNVYGNDGRFSIGRRTAYGTQPEERYIDGGAGRMFWFWDNLTDAEHLWMFNVGNLRAFSEL